MKGFNILDLQWLFIIFSEYFINLFCYIRGCMTFRSIVLPIGIYSLRMLLIQFLLPEADIRAYESYKMPPPEHFFDFIVVGSGSAGAAVAARLSENPDWDVLVLESGGPPTPESYVPAFDVLLYENEINWGYKIEPQKKSMFGYTGRSNLYPRGRVIGGTSSINFMMYVRGNKRDYDNWADMGNAGWDYESVLPYFKKSEDYAGNLNKNNSRYHGVGGPMKVSSQPWGTPLQRTFLEAGLELGYPTIDPNAESQIGFSTPDMTINNGVRVSTAEAFLKPNLKRENLRVLPHCHVTEVIFDDQKRAVGVAYMYNGKRHVTLTKREVILSAGAIDSPKILMLSGVGPRQHLEKHNISVVHDLPGVGQNLQDHPVIFGLTWTVNSGNAASLMNLLNPATLFNYLRTRRGPLSTAFGVEGNSWAQLSGGDPEWPDSQFLLISSTSAFDRGLLFQSAIGYDRELFEKYFGGLYGREGFSIGPIIVRPKSRGSITLRSNNPADQAIIDPKFFDHPDDLAAMVRAIKFSLRIGNTTAFRSKHGAKFHDMPLPGCEHLLVGSDEYWACYARHMTSTVYHPTGSCKMAPASDPMGVVDSRLRVRGVKGLRVIDASIMPEVPNGNTNAPSIMVGERGVDLVVEDWVLNRFTENLDLKIEEKTASRWALPIG